ncbi:MAG: peptidoglycan DD-metalloendopeptidase family protein [Bacteroidales bacterium]|nr:peptidoglycan DD-metalloendopeptidase family protein [Bacteroidales bacterium]
MNRTTLIILFLFISLLYPVYTFCQVVQPDSCDIENFQDIEGDSIITLDTNTFVPDDIMFIPSSVLYNHYWDNNNIRMKRYNPSTMNDTTRIFFNNSIENKFIFPCKCKYISGYGYRGRHFHSGVDLKLNKGDSILSALPGKVRITRYISGYGKVIVIRHYNGLETVYAHLSKIIVKVNQDVEAGELIGYGGCTGRATTNHLHFEVRYLEHTINPEQFINFNKNSLNKDTLILTSNIFKSTKTNIKPSNYKKSKKINHNYYNKKITSGNYHIIRKGDTLSLIAKKYGTSVEKLCKLNNISKTKILHLGNKIIIK